MANTRQTVVDALKTILATVPTTVSTGVYDWRDEEREPLDSSELPAILINDREDQVDELGVVDNHTMAVSIKILSTGLVSAVEAREAGRVISKLIHDNYTLDGSALNCHKQSFDILTEQYGDTLIAAHLEYTIIYRTPPGEL